MQTGAIVAIHGGEAADTETISQTVCEAGMAVEELISEKTPDGTYPVHPEGVEEAVADKGYHSNEKLSDLAVRSYIAEPECGPRKWRGQPAEKEAVYANGRRIRGDRGEHLLAQRGERIERNFAHQFDIGGMNRLYLRDSSNVHKKLLLQAAVWNVALLMPAMLRPRHSETGSGPRHYPPTVDFGPDPSLPERWGT